MRRRYDTLNVSFLSLIEQIVERCEASDTALSFCGEDAGRPIEALCFAAIGIRCLSMRPASIGPVKSLLRRCDHLIRPINGYKAGRDFIQSPAVATRWGVTPSYGTVPGHEGFEHLAALIAQDGVPPHPRR